MSRKLIKITTIVLLLFLFILFPAQLFAQDQSIWSDGIVPCKGLDCSVCDVFKLVSNLIRLVWSGAALVGTVAFMYGGFLYWRGEQKRKNPSITPFVRVKPEGLLIGSAVRF